MKIGPKYKIARRLGASIFEKTQTQKYALSLARKKNVHVSRARTSYSEQVLEKQRVRFSYNITAGQLERYTKGVVASRAKNQEEALYQKLESRLDSIVLRAGFAATRQMARQAVSHAHFTLNGKKSNVPSMEVKEGDIVAVREGSKAKVLFAGLEEKTKSMTFPAWIEVDVKGMSIKVKGVPVMPKNEMAFDLGKIIQFYKR